MKTIFLDIDGTIFHQDEDQTDVTQWVDFMHTEFTKVLKGSATKCLEWHMKGYCIVLTTGRPSTMRESCIRQLAQHNIIYDQLIMDLGPAPRYLINNKGHEGELKAMGINLETNQGIGGINLNDN